MEARWNWYFQGQYPAGTLTRGVAVMGLLPLGVRSISDLMEEAEFPRAAFKENAVRASSIEGLCRAQGLDTVTQSLNLS